MQWHWLDLIILAIVALSALTGLFRGFVKELVALSVWVLGIWLGYRYAPLFDPLLSSYIHDKTAKTVAAFIIILLVILIVGALVNAVLSALLRKSGLSGTDRLLGMGFGLVRGVFIVALIMLMINLTSLPQDQYRKESLLYAKFDPLVAWLYGLLPEFIQKMKVLDKGMVVMEANPDF